MTVDTKESMLQTWLAEQYSSEYEDGRRCDDLGYLQCKLILKPDRFTFLPNTAGCFTGEEAVRTLRLAREAGGWDLVILDWWLPGRDGLEVLSGHRRQGGTTPVLFLTARADIGDHDRLRSTGAVGHVTKPFNPSSLGDEVRAALSR